MTELDNNNYRKPFSMAVVLHVLLFIILIMHFKFLPKPNPVVQNSASIIKAVAINQNQLQEQLNQIQAAQQAQLRQQQAAQQLQQKQLQQQQAAQQLAAEQAQQKAEQAAALAQQVAQQKIAAEKAAAEQQQLKAEEAKQAAALKVQQEKAREEQKRLAQQAIQQALAQQEKQNAKEQQQKQLQAAKLAAQQLLQQQLAAADSPTKSDAKASQSKPLSAAAQGQVDKYSALITQAISQQWIIPDTAQKNLQAKVEVKVAPGGMVVSVNILQGSGDAAFDRAARAAVFKASPLPVPTDSAVFNQFRTLNLTFRPEGITNT